MFVANKMDMAVQEAKVIWRIKSIELLSYKAEEKVTPAIEYNPDKIDFELGMSFNIDSATRMVTVLFHVQIFADATHSEALGSINTKGEFLIINFDELMKLHENSLPINIVAALVGVTLSTTRGMLILLSKGTVFEKAIIPIINPIVFFNQAVIQENPEKVLPGPTG